MLAQDDQNFIISPPGLMAASAAMYLGAGGDTESSMRNALHLTELPHAQLVSAAAQQRRSWASAAQRNKLELLQWVAVDGSVNLVPQWEREVRQAFDARIEHVNFASDPDGAIAHIDAAAEKATRGRVQSLIDPAIAPPDSLRLVLLSSVYFKGAWKYRFDASWTRDHEFTPLDGTPDTVRMMRQETRLLHERLDSDGVETLELPYQGSRLGLVIVLPLAPNGLPAVEAQLSFDALERWVPTHPREVDLWLPRVHASSTIDLRAPLERLGVRALFGPGADLSRLHRAAPTVGVDQALHRCTLEISEEGTIATSITTYLELDFGDGHPPNRPVVFRVDHPFLFYIRDRTSGAVLFLGRVNHPGYEPAATTPTDQPPRLVPHS